MMQGVRVEMTGQRFGRLLVQGFAETRAGRARWQALCDCGASTVVEGKYLRNGRTTSCGCFHRELTSSIFTTHGMSSTSTYGIWRGMISRCTNPKQEAYAKYGAKGVRVCDRWLSSFENFLADMGERPPGLTLERNNPFGNYEPDNCCWATPETQGRNRRGDVAQAIIEDLVRQGHGSLVDAAFRRRYQSPAKAFEDGYTRMEG